MKNSDQHCPNCGASLVGPFCAHCGQDQVAKNREVWVLLNEAFEGVFSWDSKALRTIKALFAKPGFLTTEHFANRRARYVSPLRLYIVTSVFFFFVLTTMNFLGLNVQGQVPADSAALPAEPTKMTIEDVQALISVDESDPEFLKQLKTAAGSDLKELIARVIDKLPVINFLLLPIFALVLKLLFLKSNRFYVEHVVLALHNSSFLFAAYALMSIVQPLLRIPALNIVIMIGVLVWSSVYVMQSLKNVYQLSWASTINKGMLFGLLQLMLTAVGVFLSIYLTITID